MSKRGLVCIPLCAFLILALLAACSGRPTKYEPKMTEPEASEHIPMPRADPAYVQYLERQSMLAKSAEMAKVVSGSELAWRPSASSGSPEALLDFADAWIQFHPLTMLSTSRSSAFNQLAGASTWPILRELGVKGIYVAPAQGGGAQWAKERLSVDTGDDVVQYEFSRPAGDDGQYRRLMSSVIDNTGLLGSDLVPAATGLGPDFFLAARNVREYPGIYCMVEIPESLWSHLPDVTEEWSGAALGQSQVAALNAQGLLPKAMRDEVSPMARMGGWAATGAIRGVDGNRYRWVYRYYHSPDYAVLNWEDPSQAAHRILSASAVRQVGMQGQALVGLRFEAFQGLEAAPEGGARNLFSVEPARTASVAMSREIRRYGGWSWARDDDLSLNNVRDYLSSGVDFIFDSVFSPAAEHALLTGDASLARFMADEALRLNIDMRRLVHTTPAQDGINYSLPHLAFLAAGAGGERAASFRGAVQGAMRSRASRMNPVPVQDNYLYTTAAGLAALALGVPNPGPAHAADIEKGHSLLIFFKAMQPGLMMLAGQDLSGVLPLDAAGMAAGSVKGVPGLSRGSYGLTSASNTLVVTTQGMPRAPQAYIPPDAQVHQRDSFLHRTGAFMKQRAALSVSRGSLAARPNTKGEGSIALLTRLPGSGGWLLTVCNFSRSAVSESFSLPDVPGSAFSKVSAVRTGGRYSRNGRSISVSLGPWEGMALILGGSGGPDAQREDETAAGAENVTPIPDPPEPPREEAAQATAPEPEKTLPATPAAEMLPASAPAPLPAQTETTVTVPAAFQAPPAAPLTPPAPAHAAEPAPAAPAPVAAPTPVQPPPAPLPAPVQYPHAVESGAAPVRILGVPPARVAGPGPADVPSGAVRAPESQPVPAPAPRPLPAPAPIPPSAPPGASGKSDMTPNEADDLLYGPATL